MKPSPFQNPQTYTMTPMAWRARRPFFWKNVALASVLFGASIGVYYYTLSVIKKDDDFDDVPVPPISDADLAKLKSEYEKTKQQKN